MRLRAGGFYILCFLRVRGALSKSHNMHIWKLGEDFTKSLPPPIR